MKFGYFDDKNREYVITTPKTPLPWINYLGCNDFFSLISNTCGGYSFYKDAKLLRLTRYRYNNVPADTNGKYFYIKDNDTVWNPGWQPSQTPLDSYECRHGIGYSRFTSSKNELKASLLTFVPMNDTCEVSQLKLTNESSSSKNISVFSYVEWCLWNADDDMKNFQRNFSTGEVEVSGSTIFHKTEYRERRNHYSSPSGRKWLLHQFHCKGLVACGLPPAQYNPVSRRNKIFYFCFRVHRSSRKR